MISFGRSRKPKLIGNVRIDVVGDGERMVLMSMETIDHKKVTVGMFPETAFEMLEELSRVCDHLKIAGTFAPHTEL